MDRVVSLLQENTLDVVGFQEFQPPQATRFQELMGTSWQTYPGLNNPAGPSVNSIGWRTDVWTLLEARTIPIRVNRAAAAASARTNETVKLGNVAPISHEGGSRRCTWSTHQLGPVGESHW